MHYQLKTVSLAFIAFLLIATITSSREWTDATGKYKVEAELIEVKGNQVHLRKSDGKTVVVPLQSLSVRDRQFVKERPPKPAVTSPDAKAIDVKTFLTAHSRGEVDKYKGFTITGAGQQFFGTRSMTAPGKSPKISYMVTPFRVLANGTVVAVNTMKDSVEAQMRGERLLHVVVIGEGFKEKSGRIQFTGTFNGDVEDIPNIVNFGGQAAKPNFSPVLVNGTVKP